MAPLNLALLAACSGPEPEPTPTPTAAATGETGTTPASFEALAEGAGFAVQPGEFTFLDPQDCCAPCGNCLWNNPSTPYGSYRLPRAPDQVINDPAPNAAGPTFWLRHDEAVVFLGRTPPPAAYFSWRSYLSERVVQAGDPIPPRIDPECSDRVDVGDRALVIGSLGPSLNHLVVGERLGDPFDRPFAVVTTADAAVEDEVTSLLVASGWDPAHVFYDRIPAGDPDLGVTTGFSAQADTFQVAVRIAVYEDEAAGAAYEADPGAVWRLTPTVERAPERLHPRPALPPIGAGTTEAAWEGAVDELASALVAAWPDLRAIEETSTAWDYPTFECVDALYCSGEIRDRYYANVPRFWLLDDGSFAVAFGVNHQRTGKASYANLAVDTVENLIGVDSVNSPELVGSARAWLPDHPQVDDLYAWIVTRDCAPHAGKPCLEVGTDCPTGVPLDQPMLLSFRAYLEPATGSKPLASELLPDRVTLFVPEASK